MNTLTNRVVALSAAALFGIGLLSPAMAAQQNRSHVRAAPTAQSEGYAQEQAPWSGYGRAYNQAPSGYGYDSFAAQRGSMPNRCVTDDGYGRYSDCDYSGS